jgi:hypothetical protein
MFALIFGSVFVLCGVTAISIARVAFKKDRAIASWPRAPGTITSSRIETRKGKVRDQQGYWRDHTVFKPIVEFTYTVDGFKHRGDQIARVVYAGTKKPDLGKYAPGTEVMVYYDPKDPKTAYLELGRSGAAVVLTVMGGVFVAIGVVVAVLVNVL